MQPGPGPLPPVLNVFFLTGRVLSRQRLKITGKGAYLVEFEMAAGRPVGPDAGPAQMDVFDIEIWGDAAREMDRSLQTGSQVYVEGRLVSREFEDRGGIRHRRTVLKSSRVEILGG
ncbi:MAG: single-stranded DNA-binding protein [Candidatus Fermentibacter sp.]|nr:single-stranded DNA-binding protein [Candidatus Fermentibacter sp.]